MPVEPTGRRETYIPPDRSVNLPEITSGEKTRPSSLLWEVQPTVQEGSSDDVTDRGNRSFSHVQINSGEDVLTERTESLIVETEKTVDISSLEEAAKKDAPQLVQTILRKMEEANSKQELLTTLSEISNPIAEFGKEAVAEPLESVGKEIFQIPEELASGTAEDIFIVEFANTALQTSAKGVLLIYKRTLISAMKENINTNKEITAEQKAVLNLWLEKQELKLKKEAIQTGLKALAYAPRGTKLILKLVDKLPTSFAIPYLSVLGVFVAALYVYKARQLSKSLNSQKKWMETLRNKPIGEIEGSGLKENINNIIEARKDRYDKRAAEFDKDFDHFVDELTWHNSGEKLEGMPHPKLMDAKTEKDFKEALSDPKVKNELLLLYSMAPTKKFENWLKDLTLDNREVKLKGIDSPKLMKATSQEDFQNNLQDTQTQNEMRLQFAERLFEEWVQEITWENKAEKLAGTSHAKLFDPVDKKTFLEDLKGDPDVRNDLRVLFARKQFIEHKETVRIMTRNALRSQALNKHKTVRKFLKFELSRTKIAGIALVLKISAITVLKVLAVATIIAVPTIALTLTGVGIFAVTAALLAAGLYMLYRHKPNLLKELARGTAIRAAFYEVPAQIQKMRATSLSMKIAALQLKQNNPQEKEKIEKLEAKQKILQAKAEEWEGKLKPLQERLKKAKEEDYMRKAKGRVNEILVEGLLEDAKSPIDPESQEILRKHFGIRLERIQQLPKDQKDAVNNAFLRFFAKDEAEMTAFIQEQESQERLQTTRTREVKT